jgi:hypothetical protein
MEGLFVDWSMFLVVKEMYQYLVEFIWIRNFRFSKVWDESFE